MEEKNEKNEIADTEGVVEKKSESIEPEEKSNIDIVVRPEIENNKSFRWAAEFTDSKEFKKHLNKPIKEFDEEESKFYKRLQKREQLKKKEEKEEKIKLEKTRSIFDPDPETEKKKEIIEVDSNLTEEDLFIQLETLKTKFPDIGQNIEINKNMSLDSLKMKYKLFMTLIEQKHADSVAFNVFLLLNKCVERTAEGYFNTDCLNGLGDNVLSMKSEITDILKEMVSSGEIPVEMLTPQLRLLMVMSGIVVQTIEQNRAKNSQTASISEED
mgnify:CR=1 FL=1|tara:strand:- start:1894 stop:2703 length:810 start_codon:yes stop_codon:yes gene_type:complete